jgi:hypothetical protein
MTHLCAPNGCGRYRPAGQMAQAFDTATCHLGFAALSERYSEPMADTGRMAELIDVLSRGPLLAFMGRIPAAARTARHGPQRFSRALPRMRLSISSLPLRTEAWASDVHDISDKSNDPSKAPASSRTEACLFCFSDICSLSMRIFRFAAVFDPDSRNSGALRGGAALGALASP